MFFLGPLELILLVGVVVGAVIVVALLLGAFGSGVHEKRVAPPRMPEASKVIEPATPPYGIDSRPTPAGEDPERLLPERVGDFERISLVIPDDLAANSVDATYQAGRRQVYMQLGICDDPAGARQALDTAKAETDAEFPDEPQEAWLGREPSFFKTTSHRGAFLAWTRGAYYFSAHARTGEDDLDAFMEAFP